MFARNRFTWVCMFVLLLLTAPWRVATAAEVTFQIGPRAAWVRDCAPDLSPNPSAGPASEGVDYLLVDEQEQVQTGGSYYHQASRIMTEKGLQSGSAVTASFDPSYQKLTFHFIRLIRNGVVLDRLDRGTIRVFQREKEMEYYLLDGQNTAQCQLEDVRVGDVVEYAYTLDGENPVVRGHYTTIFSTNWSSPLRHLLLRVVWPDKRVPEVRIFRKKIAPVVTQAKGQTEWVWEEQNLAEHREDSGAPGWYDSYGLVQFSEFASWQAVVDWALPLYAPMHAPVSGVLGAEVARLKAIPGEDARVAAALRFVQDEIRYLGIETGVNSHYPSAPTEVLRRRFGDCKDKSLLLCTLLQNIGVEAVPALVNTSLRQELDGRLPSPFVFNHVIARVVTASGVHWLDPTRANQRGPLWQIYVADYQRALVLRPGEKGLTTFEPPKEALFHKEVRESFQVGRPGEASRLEVTTSYRGVAAEEARDYFGDNSPEKIQHSYLQFYARKYPDVQSSQPPTLKELPDGMGCVMTENYLIPNIWQLLEDKGKYTVEFYPSEIDEQMGSRPSPRRQDPYALSRRETTVQEITAEMFKPWSLTPADEDVPTKFFHFQHKARLEGGNVMRFFYQYENVATFVPADEVQTFNTEHKKVEESLGYTISYTTPKQLEEKKAKSPAESEAWNWPILSLLGGLSVGLIYAMRRLWLKAVRPEPLPPSLVAPHLEGLTGWLLVVAFGCLFRPFNHGYNIYNLWASMSKTATWENLTHPGNPAYHAFWAPALLFEAVFNLAALAFCVLLIILFFQKRAVFRWYLISYFVIMLAALVVDLLLIECLPSHDDMVKGSINALTGSTFYSAIWIPYLILSKRVAATFRY